MFVIVTGILLLAILADVTTRRIPNALIIAGLLTGLLFKLLDEGPTGLVYSLKEILLATVVFYIFYLLRALGAGDVKLLIVLASFLGATCSIRILCVSLVIGALIGVIRLVIVGLNSLTDKEKRKEGLRNLLTVIYLHNFDLLCKKAENLLMEKFRSDNLCRIPYSPIIFAGTLIVWRLWR